MYPDSGKIGVWGVGEQDALFVRKGSGVGYFDGEI